MKTDIPIIYSTDATFKLLYDYYPQYTGLAKGSVSEGHAVEQHAINRSDLIICATQWADGFESLIEQGLQPQYEKIIGSWALDGARAPCFMAIFYPFR